MASPAHFKPTKADLVAARNKTVPDLVKPGLRILFVGINPGLYTAAIGHHFGRPGNRFWPALHASGFTPRQFSPFEEAKLLKLGIGISNIVKRTTPTADELSNEEVVAGGNTLKSLIQKYKPKAAAVLGIIAYRTAFGKPHAQLGLQKDTIGGIPAWVLPNPSGLNAHFKAADFAKLFTELRLWLEKNT